jgi:23S rRNA pseudouridine1911/1915/1917 synthase
MSKQQLYLIESFEVKDIRQKERIDVYLHRHFPETTRTSFQKQLKKNHIHVNGHFADKAFRLTAGDRIEIFSPYKSKTGWQANNQIVPDIVFEDDVILVVNKPAGLQVHPATGNYNNTLVNGLIAYLSKSDQKPFLVHRLDKYTEGLLVFAKNEKARDDLSEQFSNRIAHRKYKALVWGKLKNDETINKPIGRDKREGNTFRIFEEGEKGGKNAITHFRLIKSYPFHSFIECELETGRTHQIRVHFQSIGNPLVGDFEYGGNKLLMGIRDEKYIQMMDDILDLFKGQALLADHLVFKHPLNGERMVFNLELPINFAQALEILETCKKTWG